MGLLIPSIGLLILLVVSFFAHAQPASKLIEYKKGELYAHFVDERDRCSHVVGAWCASLSQLYAIATEYENKPFPANAPGIRNTRAHSERLPEDSGIFYYAGALSNEELKTVVEIEPPVIVVDTLEPRFEVPSGYRPVALFKSKMGIGVMQSDHQTANNVSMARLKGTFTGEHDSPYGVVVNAYEPHRNAAMYCLTKLAGVDPARTMATIQANGKEVTGYTKMMNLVKTQQQNENVLEAIAFGVRGLHRNSTAVYATIDGISLDDPKYPIWTNMLVFVNEDKTEDAYKALDSVVEETDLGEPLLK